MCCRNFMQKMKVLAVVGFSSAAGGKWNKMNKWKLFASLFFLPNYSGKGKTSKTDDTTVAGSASVESWSLPAAGFFLSSILPDGKCWMEKRK